MFSQIQKKPLLQFLCQDSMSISTTSSLPWSLASVRLSSFIASMSARSIGGKGFLQYWKVLYCQNSSLICALTGARAHAPRGPGRWLVEARGTRSQAPPRPEVRAAGEGGKAAARFLKARWSQACFPGAEEDVHVPRSVKLFRLKIFNIYMFIFPFLESSARRIKTILYKLLLSWG